MRCVGKAGATNRSRRISSSTLFSRHIPWPRARSGVCIAGIGWLIRTVATGSFGLRRSQFDLIIAVIAALDYPVIVTLRRATNQYREAQASWVILHLLSHTSSTQSSSDVLAGGAADSFGLRARFTALLICCADEELWLKQFARESPFQHASVFTGRHDLACRATAVSIPSPISTECLKHSAKHTFHNWHYFAWGTGRAHGTGTHAAQLQQTSPAGMTGTERNHRFRASGFTRHYQTFAEVIQMIALLAWVSRSHISEITARTSISKSLLSSAGIDVSVSSSQR